MEVFDASHRNPNIISLHPNASFLSDKIGVSEKNLLIWQSFPSIFTNSYSSKQHFFSSVNWKVCCPVLFLRGGAEQVLRKPSPQGLSPSRPAHLHMVELCNNWSAHVSASCHRSCSFVLHINPCQHGISRFYENHFFQLGWEPEQSHNSLWDPWLWGCEEEVHKERGL